MADALVVALDPPQTTVKPGEERAIAVTVRSNSEVPVTYLLTLAGPAELLAWASLQPADPAITAFDLQDGQATVILRPPAGEIGAIHTLEVRAASQRNGSALAVGTLAISIDAPAPAIAATPSPPAVVLAAPVAPTSQPPPQPIDEPAAVPIATPAPPVAAPPPREALPPTPPPPVSRPTAAPSVDRPLSPTPVSEIIASAPGLPPASGLPPAAPNLELTAEAIADSALPRTIGQWRLRLRNRSSTTETFGFSITRVAPLAVRIDPAEITVRPGEVKTAILTVRVPDESPDGNLRLQLNAYPIGDPQQSQELPLTFLVRSSGAPAPQPQTGSPSIAGPLNLLVSQDLFVMAPRVTQTANLDIQNRSDQTINLSLGASGVPVGWVAVAPTSLTLAPQQIGPATITIATPEDAPSGAYPVTVQGRVGQNPALGFRIELLVQVNAPDRDRTSRILVDARLGTAAPGNTLDAPIVVQNQTRTVTNVRLQLGGIERTWVAVDPPNQMVFGLGEGRFGVRIQVPSDPTRALAGTYPLTIQSELAQVPGDAGKAETELEILLIGEYQVDLAEVERAAAREASFSLRVRNRTNAPLTLQFNGRDRDDALLYLFDPPDLNLPADGAADVTLLVRARELAARTRPIDFSIETTGEYAIQGGKRREAAPHEIAGRFRQVAAPAIGVSVEPKSITGRDGGDYLVRVRNPTTSPLAVALAASDPTDQLTFEVAPSEMALDPSGEKVAKLLARRRRQGGTGQREEHRIVVSAKPAEDDDVFPADDAADLIILRKSWLERLGDLLQKFRGWWSSFWASLRRWRYWKWLLAALALLLLAALLLWLVPRFLLRRAAPAIATPLPVATALVPSAATLTSIAQPTAAPATATPVPITPTAAAPTPSPSAASTPVAVSSAVAQQVKTLFGQLPTPAAAVFEDLADPSAPTRVELNATTEVPAASTAKLPVMIAVWQQLKDGKLKPTDTFTVTKDKVVGGTGILQNQVGRTLTTEELLEVTLLNSDNTGANMLIDRIGGLDQVNATLKTLGFSHTHIGRHFMDDQALAKGLDNTLSPGDMALMLEQIYRGQLISKAASDDMHRILLLRGQETDPTLDYMGRKLVPRPPLAHVNGVLTGIRNDGGVVEASSGPFIVVIFLNHQANETAAEDAIATTTAAIFNALNSKH
jgi:beta-lactamase class A